MRRSIFAFFVFFPSYLYTRLPEIIFDAPRRLDPGQDLPVVLIVNDCHRFPVQLSDCAIAVSRPRSPTMRFDFPDLRRFEITHPLQKTMRAFVFSIPRGEISTGTIDITCTLIVSVGRRREAVINDNLRTTAKKPFTCYVSDEKLPGSRFCTYGDLHMHSHYSQSHVEFGPPLAIIGRVARASGLSFAAITDHSYDLACSMGDYLMTDPSHRRWQSFLSELAALIPSSPILIPGEEISCLNEKNRVVHLCGLNVHDYLPGTLDGARKDRREDPQPTLSETIRAVHEQGGIAFAAHPGIRPGILAQLFLHRGKWSRNDLDNRLDAMQIVNNGFSPSFHRGRTMWLEMLRRGHRIPLVAGNDAHGDFNRFRAIAIPFLAISENYGRYMGFGRTGIYGRTTSKDAIIGGIKNGATFVTTGPYIKIGFPHTESYFAESDALPRNETTPSLKAISTSEFGAIKSITIYGFKRESGEETTVYSKNYTGPPSIWEAEFRIPLPAEPLSYLRAEVTCAADRMGQTMAYTSPFFLGS